MHNVMISKAPSQVDTGVQEKVEQKASKKEKKEGNLGVLGMEDHYAECYPG